MFEAGGIDPVDGDAGGVGGFDEGLEGGVEAGVAAETATDIDDGFAARERGDRADGGAEGIERDAAGVLALEAVGHAEHVEGDLGLFGADEVGGVGGLSAEVDARGFGNFAAEETIELFAIAGEVAEPAFGECCEVVGFFVASH